MEPIELSTEKARDYLENDKFYVVETTQTRWELEDELGTTSVTIRFNRGQIEGGELLSEV